MLLPLLLLTAVGSTAAVKPHVLHIVSDVSEPDRLLTSAGCSAGWVTHRLTDWPGIRWLRAACPDAPQDLGYNDLGIRNGGKTITPHIDELIRTGVTLSSYCAPRVAC